MADNPNTLAPAASGSASSTVSGTGNADRERANTSPVPKDPADSAANVSAGAEAARSGKPIARAGVITNPTPQVDPDVAAAQVAEANKRVPDTLPQGTIDE